MLKQFKKLCIVISGILLFSPGCSSIEEIVLCDKKLYTDDQYMDVFEHSPAVGDAKTFIDTYASMEGAQDYTFYVRQNGYTLFSIDGARHTYSLLVSYNQENYNGQKNRLLGQDVFFQETVYDDLDEFLLVVPEVTIEAHTFLTVKQPFPSYYGMHHYVEQLGLISYSDSLRIIGYHYLIDVSLDYFEDLNSYTTYVHDSLKWINNESMLFHQ